MRWETPGGTPGISVNGTVSPIQASFTYNEVKPPSTGRIPTTLVVPVPLAADKQTIQGMWYDVRGSKVIIDAHCGCRLSEIGREADAGEPERQG